MRKHVRRLVVNFLYKPNDSPDEMSRKLWPNLKTAILECGHKVELGVCVEYNPRHMACFECGPTRQRWERVQR